MSNEEKPLKERLKDRAKQLVQDILEAIEDLFPMPEPELIPVRVEGRGRRRRR
jgi:hypothetical protein